MLPLTPDDLLPLDEYARGRAEFFRAHVRYLDRYRRVRLGPRLTLIFENRQTLWFRVQELLHVARLAEPVRVRLELDWYNRLLPRRECLGAALVIDRADGADPEAERRFGQELVDAKLELCAGPVRVRAEFVTGRPEDRCIGTAHWLEFVVEAPARQALGNLRLPVWFNIACPGYQYEGVPLVREVRQSLLDDLALSDRDGGLTWAA